MDAGIKREAYLLVERLPEDATWEDLMYEIYGRQAVESGPADSEADRVLELSEVRARQLPTST